MDEYQVASRDEAERLDAAAEASAAEVRLDIQRSSNYVLTVVLYAVVLFFAGMSTRLARPAPALGHDAGRLRRPPRRARLDRHLPGQPRGLTRTRSQRRGVLAQLLCQTHSAQPLSWRYWPVETVNTPGPSRLLLSAMSEVSVLFRTA